MANYAKRRPALGWGGPKFTESAESVSAAGSWAGGAMTTPVIYPPAPGGSPLGGFVVTSVGMGTDNNLNFQSSALALWADTLTLELRDSQFDVVITGLTPGDTFSWRCTIQFNADTVPGAGALRLESIGATTASLTVPRGNETTLFVNGAPSGILASLATVVPPSGEVTIRVYAVFGGSHFMNVDFRDLEFGTLGTGARPNLLVWGTPPFRVATWPVPGNDTSWTTRFPSGRRSVWNGDDEGVFDLLELYVPYIPQVDRLRVGGPNGLDASGADGATGWRAALEYLRDGGAGTWYPDQDDLELEPTDCVLLAPLRDRYERGDASLLRALTLRLMTLEPGATFPEY